MEGDSRRNNLEGAGDLGDGSDDESQSPRSRLPLPLNKNSRRRLLRALERRELDTADHADDDDEVLEEEEEEEEEQPEPPRYGPIPLPTIPEETEMETFNEDLEYATYRMSRLRLKSTPSTSSCSSNGSSGSGESPGSGSGSGTSSSSSDDSLLSFVTAGDTTPTIGSPESSIGDELDDLEVEELQMDEESDDTLVAPSDKVANDLQEEEDKEGKDKNKGDKDKKKKKKKKGKKGKKDKSQRASTSNIRKLPEGSKFFT